MKNWKQDIIGVLAVIVLTFALNACKDESEPDPEQPAVPQAKTITQADGLAFNGKVTISTGDQYLVADWNAVVDKVIAALNRGYNKFASIGGMNDDLNKDDFEMAFGASKNAEIIVSSTGKSIEVLSTDYTKMYLKASVINNTLDLQPAVEAMAATSGGYELANAKSAKGGVFFVLWDETFIVNNGVRHNGI